MDVKKTYSCLLWVLTVVILLCVFQSACNSGPKIPDLDWVKIPDQSFAVTGTEITQNQYFIYTRISPSRFSGCGQCPVEMVTWSEAEAFCRGVDGRLPTESEWRLAAKGGADTVFNCGDDKSCLGDIAWHYFNSGGKTHPVGQKKPNGFNLYGMAGNVAEWVAGIDGEISADKNMKSTMGGSWYSVSPEELTPLSVNQHKADKKDYGIGFRCVRDQ